MNLFKAYELVRDFVFRYLNEHWPRLHRHIYRRRTGVKYIFSGGIAAMVNLFFLYALTDIFGIWYLISSIAAFVASLLASFFLQKFWTFRDRGWERIKKQSTIYIALGAADFILTPILLYTFVEKFHIWYILASIIVMGTLAIVNYLINKFITFKKDIAYESVND